LPLTTTIRDPRWWLRFGALAVAYVAAALLGFAVPYVGTMITLIWLPSGIALAALVRWGLPMWPAIFVAAACGNLIAGGNAATALLIAVGNTAGPVAGVLLLRRFGFNPQFAHRRDMLLLTVFGAAGAMAITATNGVLALLATGFIGAERLPGAWLTWWLGDAVGVLLAGVPLMVFSGSAVREALRGWRGVETAALMFVTLAVALWLFVLSGSGAAPGWPGPAGAPLLFVPFVLLVWIALRSGLLAASATVLGLSVIAAWGTSQGLGPFYAEAVHQSLTSLSAYLIATVLVVLLLAGLLAELQGRERLSDALIRNADAAILLTRPDGSILRANPAAHALFGAGDAQFAERGHAGFVDAADPRLGPLLAERAEHGRASGQLSFVRADGSRFEGAVSSMLLPGDARGPLSCVMVWDVTAREKAASALAASEARLKLALAAGRMGAWEWEAGADVSSWDATCYALYGIDPSEPATFARVVRQVHPDDRKALTDAVTQSIRDQHDLEAEFRVVHGDGRIAWLATRGRGVHADDGRLLRMSGLSFDITAQREAEQALIAAATAERASRAKTEFLSRMSHELRTPLNAVLGFAQLLDLDPSMPSLARGHARRIIDAGQHLLAMINDVLDLSRIEAGRVAMSIEPIDVRSAVARTVSLLEPIAAAAGVTLIDSGAGEPGLVILADRVRLQQVLANLVSNAIKYNRGGGSVSICCAALGDEVHLSISDTGIGMTAAQQAQLFQPFNRLGAEASGIEGTGIGLTVVKGLVELMRGRIEVDSASGQGSRFSVSLPAAEAHGMRSWSAAGAQDDADRTDRHSVLYAEDNEINVLLVRQALALLPGVELRVASSGAQALAAAREQRPDLLLLDLHLGDMLGTEVKAQLDADAATRDLPCIVLSADATAERRRAARAVGVLDYLTKPVDVPVLLERVTTVLRQARALTVP